MVMLEVYVKNEILNTINIITSIHHMDILYLFHRPIKAIEVTDTCKGGQKMMCY